jgi:hypothetical protein
MLPQPMAVRNSPARSLFIFLTCAAALGGGFWYARGGGFWEDEQSADDDEEEEPGLLKPDSGAPRRRPKKSAPRLSTPRPKKKPSEARQARSPAPAHAAEDPPRAVPPHAGPTGPSYESAIAGNVQHLAPGTKEAPDLTDGELAGPLRDGSFLDACGVPSSTQVTVKVAIRNGRSVGISVYSTPPSQSIAGCVEEHVRGLQWPSNAKMDSFVTTY